MEALHIHPGNMCPRSMMAIVDKRKSELPSTNKLMSDLCAAAVNIGQRSTSAVCNVIRPLTGVVGYNGRESALVLGLIGICTSHYLIRRSKTERVLINLPFFKLASKEAES